MIEIFQELIIAKRKLLWNAQYAIIELQRVKEKP